MGNSWLLAGATAGMHVRISAPDGYQPDPQMVDEATRIADGTEGSVTLEPDPRAAVAGADVVVTDTWVSMGKEDEGEARSEAFRALLRHHGAVRRGQRRTRSRCTACRPTAARRSTPR